MRFAVCWSAIICVNLRLSIFFPNLAPFAPLREVSFLSNRKVGLPLMGTGIVVLQDLTPTIDIEITVLRPNFRFFLQYSNIKSVSCLGPTRHAIGFALMGINRQT